jgi:hypothetical protein
MPTRTHGSSARRETSAIRNRIRTRTLTRLPIAVTGMQLAPLTRVNSGAPGRELRSRRVRITRCKSPPTRAQEAQSPSAKAVAG